MTPPPDLIDSLLSVSSAEATLRTLTEQGYTIKVHVLHARLKQLIAEGRRQVIPQKGLMTGTTQASEPAKGMSLLGCQRLLRAQIKAGQLMPAPMIAWRERHQHLEIAA